eukprot:TRINITY_DN34144_c0_g1_i1.p1 TRINITY_DN34144_c0_g1~~TRINITY_DN34144_c0_g1_i1.p1  ORF type:complete len:496 (-),score=60.78 TRINITY_DN34144_c0_g1_i1:318-1805(-)
MPRKKTAAREGEELNLGSTVDFGNPAGVSMDVLKERLEVLQFMEDADARPSWGTVRDAPVPAATLTKLPLVILFSHHGAGIGTALLQAVVETRAEFESRGIHICLLGFHDGHGSMSPASRMPYDMVFSDKCSGGLTDGRINYCLHQSLRGSGDADPVVMIEKTAYEHTYVVDCVEEGKKQVPAPLAALMRAGEMGCFITLAVKREHALLGDLRYLDFSASRAPRRANQAKAFANDLIRQIAQHFEADREASTKIGAAWDATAKKPHSAKIHRKIELMNAESGEKYDPKREAGDRTALLVEILRDPASALKPFRELRCATYEIHLLSNELAHCINPKDPDKENCEFPRTLVEHGVVKSLLGRLEKLVSEERDYREWAAILVFFNNMSRFNHDVLGPELRTLILDGGFDFALVVARRSKDHWIRRIAESAIDALDGHEAWHYRCFACKTVMHKEVVSNDQVKLQWCTCRCRAFCSKECQKISWKSGHREECNAFAEI